MRFLPFSIIVVCIGCSAEYKALRVAAPDRVCIDRLKPSGIHTSWYDASIDVAGKHLSGILVVKNMPDQSKRVVFTNEAGVTFLDFEFSKSGGFQVKRMIRQLDKKPVIETLRKDFSLLTGIAFQGDITGAWTKGDEVFYGVSQKKETVYFITDQDCASLQRIELGSKRKRKVTVVFSGDPEEPESATITHHTFNMMILLKKLQRN